MLTHFKINLKNQKEICNLFLPYVDLFLKGQSVNLFKENDKEILILERFLKDEVKQYFTEYPNIKMCALGGLAPGNKLRPHIDGHYPPKPEQHWALNIPIKNCDESIMYWYDTDYEIGYASSTDDPMLVADNLQHLVPKYSGEYKVIDSCNLDSPVFVKVTSPHSVTNHGSKPRFMLSVRFYNELTNQTAS